MDAVTNQAQTSSTDHYKSLGSVIAYIRNIEYTYAMPNSDVLRNFKAEIFQALAHPTRIAIAEVLCRGEMSAGQIIQLLELEQANASQHLSVLRTKRIVTARKEGNQVFYSLRDRALGEVLDSLRAYFQRYLREAKADLEKVSRQEARAR